MLIVTLTYAHRSQWSIGHQRPPAIALCSGLLVIPDQLVPCCFISASVSRLQLLRGRPLFLFPCGFQVRAWRVVLDAGFLRVCPIQPHFLRSICLATGSCPAHFHRSSFRENVEQSSYHDREFPGCRQKGVNGWLNVLYEFPSCFVRRLSG